MEHLLRADQYSQRKAKLTYFLKPFTMDVFVNDCSHTSSLEMTVANSGFVNAIFCFISLACNNCPHFCLKALKIDTSSGWRRSVVCGGNFKIVTFHWRAHCRVGKPTCERHTIIPGTPEQEKRNTEHQRSSGTPCNSGGTTEHLEAPAENSKIPREHQRTTPEQRNHTKRRTIVVILKKI